MDRLEGACREVAEAAEWLAIATAGPEGPHLAGTWGDYVRELGLGDGRRILIPVGGFGVSEGNLAADPRLELLWATRAVKGVHGPGKGCRVRGRGSLWSSGEDFEAAKAKFPWIRAVLIVSVESAETQL